MHDRLPHLLRRPKLPKLYPPSGWYRSGQPSSPPTLCRQKYVTPPSCLLRFRLTTTHPQHGHHATSGASGPATTKCPFTLAFRITSLLDTTAPTSPTTGEPRRAGPGPPPCPPGSHKPPRKRGPTHSLSYHAPVHAPSTPRHKSPKVHPPSAPCLLLPASCLLLPASCTPAPLLPNQHRSFA